MADIKVISKTNVDIDKKPRVWFSCHPEDFSEYFKKICDDIFKSHDCAIYYTEDMTAAIDEANLETDLGRNNLFVIPVTFKLLSTPNRTMDVDLPYAKKEHIPVLPIMMETGINDFYSLPDKFGEMQYLNPYSSDSTEISYEDKLKKHLESILISDEMAKRIRAAFDAYIFLSYRKKDRRYANELMRLIHSYPEYRDVAIWFDEFLTPGESFRENIQKILSDSKLFTLLVTPSLLEEPDGKPNFVMAEEYPAAYNSGIEILPAEMAETDKSELCKKFKGLPLCVDPRNDEAFKARLLDALTRIATTANNTPEHNFLIGLAYLDGIDVEVDRPKAIELITMAAEAGLPEAMKKLYNMYNEGIGVQLDYRKAVIWAKAIADYHIQKYGEEHHDTLTALNNLASTYVNRGDYHKAAEIHEKTYALRCKILGEKHPDTMTSLDSLAYIYGKLDDYHKAAEIHEKTYALRCKILGEEHPDTLQSLNNLAATYDDLSEHHKALKLKKKAYALRCKILGEEHPDTLQSLNNLGCTYIHLGIYHEAAKQLEKAYELRCKILGKEHPDTLQSLSNLAVTYEDLSDYISAMYLKEKAYALRCKILGEEHPNTLISLHNLAFLYNKIGNHHKALELMKKAYALRCKVLGEEHSFTRSSLTSLIFTYEKLNDHHKELELKEKLYALDCRVLGEEHPTTLQTLNNLACAYYKVGNHHKALELQKKAYMLYRKVQGENHPDTLLILRNLAFYYTTVDEYRSALPLYEKLYAQWTEVLGADHPDTLNTLKRLNEVREKLQNDG